VPNDVPRIDGYRGNHSFAIGPQTVNQFRLCWLQKSFLNNFPDYRNVSQFFSADQHIIH
jgi:hypothetical protein